MKLTLIFYRLMNKGKFSNRFHEFIKIIRIHAFCKKGKNHAVVPPALGQPPSHLHHRQRVCHRQPAWTAAASKFIIIFLVLFLGFCWEAFWEGDFPIIKEIIRDANLKTFYKVMNVYIISLSFLISILNFLMFKYNISIQ